MRSATGRRTLLAIVAAIVGFGALKVTRLITLPLAFAVVLLLFFKAL